MTRHLTPAQRAAVGKAARTRVPRERHAAFEPAAARPDPVAVLERQAAGRVAELLPIRYGRMTASPFGFYRGAALIMAGDLAGTPVTGLTVQACGDAHLGNFGVFASADRRLVFDVNDFDETLRAPWEWDVKRLAASLEVAARDNSFSRKRCRQVVLAAVARYGTAMRAFAGLPELEVWYAPAELSELSTQYRSILGRPERKLAAADLTRIRDRDGLHTVARLVRTVKGKPRFTDEPPLVVPVTDLPHAEVSGMTRKHLDDILSGYQATLPPARRHLIGQFQVVDAARKVVGVGSVGLRCWIILLTGRDESDVLILQVKEAVPSVLAAYTAAYTAAGNGYASQGERVVAGQLLMQQSSDILLGWLPPAGPGTRDLGDCYVRQLRDWKFSFTIETMGPTALLRYAELCGNALARAHARSGDRIAIAAYLGATDAFDQAVAEFAAAYADQNERDWAALTRATTAGRLPADHGV